MDIRNGEQLLELMRGYQVPCILAAAADLDLFEKLALAPQTAAEVADASGCDLRAVTILLDALAAVKIIVKKDERYSITPALVPFLSEAFPTERYSHDTSSGELPAPLVAITVDSQDGKAGLSGVKY